MTTRRHLVAAAVAAFALAQAAGAQGTASAQGFGYPPGELSTRALGTGGSIGEIDPQSPLNPAAVALGPSSEVYAQYDPELRTATGPTGTSTTTTARFPNLGAIIPVTRRLTLGLSAATLLDRTWATTVQRNQVLGSDTVPISERLRSEGGITDLRLAAAYDVGPRVRVGVGGHLYTGSDRVTARDEFADTLRFQNISQITNLSFQGAAVSVGIEADLLPHVGIALDARKGSSLRMYANDTVLTTANVPDRYAASLTVQAIPGTLLSARFAHERWSTLNPLSTAGSSAVDGSDFGAGVESRVTRIGTSAILLRLGARRRTLPFTVAGSTVTETSFGGGLGIPIAYEHVSLDLAAQRAMRTGISGVTENATLLSFGLRVRP